MHINVFSIVIAVLQLIMNYGPMSLCSGALAFLESTGVDLVELHVPTGTSAER